MNVRKSVCSLELWTYLRPIRSLRNRPVLTKVKLMTDMTMLILKGLIVPRPLMKIVPYVEANA